MNNITNSLVGIKDPFKVQGRLMNFNITKHEKLRYSFRFHPKRYL